MPGVVNDAINRILAKGVKCFGAGPTDTAWRRLRGLKGISSLNLGRVGEVDATELNQVPDGVDEGHDEEQFFVAEQYAGTKRYEPIELAFNLVPKTAAGTEISLQTLIDWYSHDKLCTFSIRTRAGTTPIIFEFAFNAQVNEIKTTGEEGNLWNGTIALLVNTWIVYRPLPSQYAPWGATDPSYDAPGVSADQKVWNPSPPEAPFYNDSSTTAGG